MLKLTVLAMMAVAVVLASPRPAEEVYKSRLDDLNVKDILNNKRLSENFIKCFQDEVPCSPDGTALKKQLHDLLPEILETNCGKCTPEQKDKVREVLNFMKTKYPDVLKQLLDKNDPKKELRTKYKEKYTDLAKEEGFADLFD